MPGYEIRADPAENRLYMTLEGMLDADQATAAIEEVEAALSELEPGFQLVNDISAFKPVSQETTTTIEEGKKLLAAHGVSAVVRVTGESVIGKMQFDRVGSEAEGYHVATAETVAEAETLLDRFRDD